MTEAEQKVTREDSVERYLSYAFLRQSGTQNGNLKVYLQNYFNAGYNRYPKNRQQTLHLLDKYSKTVVQRTNQSKERHLCKAVEDTRGEEAGTT